MKKLVVCVVVSFFGLGLWAMGCGGSSCVDGITGPGVGTGGSADVDGGSPGSGGSSGSSAGSGVGTGGSGAMCKLVGDSCTADGECCTGSCDPGAKLCSQSTGICRAAGSACTIPQDCCTFVCNAGMCGSTQCISDNQACTTNAECCGGTCGGGKCTPLNTCRTTGNSCTQNFECCSKFCSNGICSNSGSFCTQNTDICATDAQCCSGICTKAQGATSGLCTAPHPPGVPGCTVAGEQCGAVATGDGGVVLSDAGIPSCGGACCSRACAPYKNGILICQPPSGCRPTGEICRGDADCCGFGGIQGKTGVGHCSKAMASDPVGRCDNGNACRPAGAICKLATMTCNAENNCCAGNVNQNPYVCQQDILGIPRCTMKGQACADAGSRSGQACATSADCCGLPCVPNPSFMPGATAPAFVCGGICVGTGGACTTSADCCPGQTCIAPPGSSRGTCGGTIPPGDGGIVPPSDGATPEDGSIVDAPVSTPDTGMPPVCAGYGQVCTVNSDCCNTVPCTGGRCVIIVN